MSKCVSKVKIFPFILWILSSSICVAQERVNRMLPELELVSEISSATGWILSPSGQWESAENKIPPYIKEHMSILKHSPYYSLGVDNFKHYRFYRAHIPNNDFMVFVKTYTSGAYAYPNIKEGWYQGNFTQAYAIKLNELEKLKGLRDGEVNRVSISAFDYLFVKMESEGQSLEIIRKSLYPKKANPTKAIVHFEIAPYGEKDIVQFNVWNEVTLITNHKLKMGTRHNPNINGVDIFGSESLFEYAYYETSYNSFMSLLKNAVSEVK